MRSLLPVSGMSARLAGGEIDGDDGGVGADDELGAVGAGGHGVFGIGFTASLRTRAPVVVFQR